MVWYRNAKVIFGSQNYLMPKCLCLSEGNARNRPNQLLEVEINLHQPIGQMARPGIASKKKSKGA
jgi:hypothetical protein